MKIFCESYSVGRGFSRIQSHESTSGNYESGEFFTPDGIVAVYAQGCVSEFHATKLEFVHKGVNHSKLFRGKRYSRRGIAAIAKRFARSIVHG